MSDVSELVKAASSTEYLLWTYMERIRQAYVTLTNAQTAADGKAALKELAGAATDSEKAIREILYRWQAPTALIINVNKQAAKVWRWDALSGLFVNLSHYFQRFVHAFGATEQEKLEAKVKELTAVYYLVRDLAECAEVVSAERYRQNVSG